MKYRMFFSFVLASCLACNGMDEIGEREGVVGGGILFIGDENVLVVESGHFKFHDLEEDQIVRKKETKNITRIKNKQRGVTEKATSVIKNSKGPQVAIIENINEEGADVSLVNVYTNEDGLLKKTLSFRQSGFRKFVFNSCGDIISFYANNQKKGNSITIKNNTKNLILKEIDCSSECGSLKLIDVCSDSQDCYVMSVSGGNLIAYKDGNIFIKKKDDSSLEYGRIRCLCDESIFVIQKKEGLLCFSFNENFNFYEPLSMIKASDLHGILDFKFFIYRNFPSLAIFSKDGFVSIVDFNRKSNLFGKKINSFDVRSQEDRNQEDRKQDVRNQDANEVNFYDDWQGSVSISPNSKKMIISINCHVLKLFEINQINHFLQKPLYIVNQVHFPIQDVNDSDDYVDLGSLKDLGDDVHAVETTQNTDIKIYLLGGAALLGISTFLYWFYKK